MNFKKSVLILSFCLFFSCEKQETLWGKKVNVTLKFTHHWDGVLVNNSDFDIIKFKAENGEEISISRLQYLVSNINIDQETTPYNLIDVTNETGLELVFENINTGSQKISFVFGFSDADNKDGVYKDLNSASFNVPAMLGGGYHFMQFDGKFVNNQKMIENFNYHAIRAVNVADPQNLVFQDTSFKVDLGAVDIQDSVEIEIKMNLAAWFKNPTTWDLNKLNTVLMPNFEAQKTINSNGKTVFSLGEITKK